MSVLSWSWRTSPKNTAMSRRNRDKQPCHRKQREPLQRRKNLHAGHVPHLCESFALAVTFVGTAHLFLWCHGVYVTMITVGMAPALPLDLVAPVRQDKVTIGS